MESQPALQTQNVFGQTLKKTDLLKFKLENNMNDKVKTAKKLTKEVPNSMSGVAEDIKMMGYVIYSELEEVDDTGKKK